MRWVAYPVDDEEFDNYDIVATILDLADELNLDINAWMEGGKIVIESDESRRSVEMILDNARASYRRAV